MIQIHPLSFLNNEERPNTSLLVLKRKSLKETATVAVSVEFLLLIRGRRKF